MKISDTVRMILVKFTVQKLETIPASIPPTEMETVDQLQRRKEEYISGLETIERTEDCSVVTVLDQIAQLGFELVGAFRKPMIHYRGGKQQTYHQLRLTFVRHEDVKPDMHEGFREARTQILEDVAKLCRESLWRVRVFNNPLFRNGDMDPIGRSACITLEGRRPLCFPNGKPVVEWQRDEDGYRIGDAPVPITAKHRLTIVDNTIQLVSA